MSFVKSKAPKVVFVTGGVVSSLGKGIVASILGGLINARNLKVKIKKIDPYLNVDPGTLSPLEHGEVFVVNDGAETDLDLGHYERLGGIETSKFDYITSGSIYNKIITKERNGEYLGKTVQLIPHFTKELSEAIFAKTEGVDILICEVGGTIGDIESIAILETIRQIKQSHKEKVISLHVGLLPYLKKAQEWKTKPIQHSIRELLSYGIQTDILLCRMEDKNSENWKEKISLLSNIKKDCVFEALDAKTIYHAMQNYENDGVCKKVLELLNIENTKPDLNFLNSFVSKIDSNLKEVEIAVVGKYIQCKDAYKSIEESFLHSSIFNNVKLKVNWLDAENYNIDELKTAKGILVPGGFGKRASEGKMKAIKYAEENNIPFLGICLGLQLSIIERLSRILNGVSSSEFGECENPVIALLEEWNKDNQTIKASKQLGGSMRLGAYPCFLKEGSLSSKLYNSDHISERHRHRYEFNNKYINHLEKVGLEVTGKSDNGLVEIIEDKSLDFFVACQFHPELQSSIKKPHPLFVGFIKAAKLK